MSVDHRAGDLRCIEEAPFVRNSRPTALSVILPACVTLAGILIWAAVAACHVFPESSLPPPLSVANGIVEEFHRGLLSNVVISVYRVSVGFLLASAIGIPFGLWLGLTTWARIATMPIVNFFRSLSPLAWIPFAILWFGLGDKPAIFLIFMAAVFPITLATCAAVSEIPAVRFRVARDYGYSGMEMLAQVTLPAIAPQVITSMRVTAGLSWVVVVAAEMVSGQGGLGFAVWDARNGLRNDLVVVNMIAIGIIGVLVDRLLVQLTRIPSVRWGYEQ